uniref:DUF1618 domain-containing protein n=1 Tax=Oryza punctata TaxID=4537 RepID=A0A0E0MCC9_ORYPU
MAPKRKPDGDGVRESTDEFAKPLDDTMEFTKPVYLVAVREDDQAAYSILKIDAVAGNDEPPRVRAVAVLTTGTERGMSFVTAHSKHGSWIVGVGGGLRAGTIIFDPSTLKTFQGPRLGYPKHKPVLISHGSEVYAISGTPRVKPSMDREPWFEYLSFKDGVPSEECGRWVSWHHLPPPPFFPCLLDPYEFRNPPEISVSSYAVVGSHILISPQPELVAVPLGGSLFAAWPISAASITAASVFHMSIKISSSIPVAPVNVSTPSLSIQEFKVVASEDKIPWPLFCPMGKGSFCCIRLGSSRHWHSHKANYLKKEVKVISTSFRIKNIEAIMTHCQSQGAKANDQLLAVQMKEQRHKCESNGLLGLLGSGMPVVAALSM